MELNLKRRELIQGLRGIAIILVVAHHAISNFNSVALWNSCAKFFDMFHVNIFFVIAGYLFMEHRGKYERQGFRRFIIGKAKSIFLPYYVSTFLFSVCVKIGFMLPQVAGLLKQRGYFEKNIINMLFDPFWFHKPYFTSLWFIYVLFIYFIFAWFHSKIRITISGVSTIMIVCMIVNVFCYSLYPDIIYKSIRYYPYFLFGMLLSKLAGKKLYLKKQIFIAATIGFTFVALRIFFLDISFMSRDIKAIYMQVEWLLCAICALVVLASLVEFLLCKAKGKMLVYVGDRSYHIYLFHNPWVIVPVAIVTSYFISSATINILINFAFGITIPIIMDMAYKRLSRGKCNDNQNKKYR